jgi:hypothetical protein
MNLLLICYFSVTLLELCGPSLLLAWVHLISLITLINAGPGVRNGFPVGKNSTLWVLWLFAGPSGKQEINCFEGKMVKTPPSIICNACALMSYWAGLYPAEDKDTLVARVNAMLQIAVKLLSRKAKPGETPLLQDDGGDRDEDRRNLMLGGIGFFYWQ